MRFAALAVLALLATSSATAAPSRIVVSVAEKEIVVSGVSPGADVYLFGGLQVGHTYYSSLERADLTASDDDHDGVVRFAYPKGVPFRSVWIAIDERNGDVGAGTRAGYPLRVSDIPPGAWKRKSADVDTLAIQHKALEFLLIHPGQGAWLWQADQGGRRDEDGVDDGILTITPEHMFPAKKGSGKPPHAFSAGDIVVAIDPFTLEVVTSRVPQ